MARESVCHKNESTKKLRLCFESSVNNGNPDLNIGASDSSEIFKYIEKSSRNFGQKLNQENRKIAIFWS